LYSKSWYREGRFNISRSQLLALNFSTSWNENEEDLAPSTKLVSSLNVDRRFYVRSKYNVPYLGVIFLEIKWQNFNFKVQPVSESLRVLSFLTQFTNIPRSIQTTDFQKVKNFLV